MPGLVVRPDRLLPGAFRGAPRARALLVEPHARDRAFLTSTLSSVGFVVTSAQMFSEAKACLIASPPDLLVAEIRLGADNGLGLALRGKLARPDMATVLTSRFADRMLERDVEQIGGTFVLKPLVAREFAAAVGRSAGRRLTPDGTWEPVRPPFERRVVDRRRASRDGLLRSERRAHTRRSLACN